MSGTKILAWNMEDARMEWNISRMEWRTIFHTRFCALYVQQIHIWMSGSYK